MRGWRCAGEVRLKYIDGSGRGFGVARLRLEFPVKKSLACFLALLLEVNSQTHPQTSIFTSLVSLRDGHLPFTN